MRIYQLFENTQQDLFEIDMSPGGLKSALKNIDARVGMEFEMIVPVPGQSSSFTDTTPVMNMDNDGDAGSIRDIISFFDDGDYNTGMIDDFEQQLRQDFNEWLSETFDSKWEADKETFVYDHLRDHMDVEDVAELLGLDPDDIDGLTRAQVEEAVEQVIAEDGELLSNIRDRAQEEFFSDTEELEGEWLGETGLLYMSEVQNAYSNLISWPYWDVKEPDKEESIREIALDFMTALGDSSVAYGVSYHGPYKKFSAKRQWVDIGSQKPNDCYTVEPDGSLEPDDDELGLEFVSHPQPVSEMIKDLDLVKVWAKNAGAKTGHDLKTGLHMNVSVPGYNDKRLDFVKLALLVGDQYVLKKFGRSASIYAASALGMVQDRIRTLSADQIQGLFDQMRSGLNQFASRSIRDSSTGKYSSIHPKGQYIEFRGPGGDWLGEDTDTLVSTMMRFIVSLDAAMDPQKHRKEYLSKLRRMLSANVDQDVYGDMLDQFANYMSKLQGSQAEVSGILSPEAQQALKDVRTQTYQTLKKRSQTTQTPQRPQLTAPATQPDANWAVVRRADGRPVGYFTRNTPEEAETEFERLTMGDVWTYELVPVQPRSSFVPPRSLDVLQGGRTGNWGLWAQNVGRFLSIGNGGPGRFESQADAQAWLRNFPNSLGPVVPRLIDPQQTATRAEPTPGSTQDLQQQRSQGGFTGSWRITVDGEEVHRFSGVGNVQSEANNVGREWVLNAIRQGRLNPVPGAEIDVLPIMGDQS
jgi:hypothetical protein